MQFNETLFVAVWIWNIMDNTSSIISFIIVKSLRFKTGRGSSCYSSCCCNAKAVELVNVQHQLAVTATAMSRKEGVNLETRSRITRERGVRSGHESVSPARYHRLIYCVPSIQCFSKRRTVSPHDLTKFHTVFFNWRLTRAFFFPSYFR